MLTGKPKAEAYKTSASYYKAAYEASAKSSKFYALTNWLSIENALILAGQRNWNDVGRTKKNAIEELKEELLANEESRKIAEEMNYWDLVAEANLKLCLIQLGDKEATYDNVLTAYTAVWRYAGHPGNRQAEIEHFEFLEDVLSVTGTKSSKVNTTQTQLFKKIGNIKKELEQSNSR